MMKRTRKQYPSVLKAKIVLEVFRETKTIAELASEHHIQPNLITKWKQAAIADLPTLFERGAATDEKAEARFTRPLIGSGIQVSMDGRGRYVGNIFTERLCFHAGVKWRSVKYEEVYRNEYESLRDARERLSRYLSFYNKERLHQALGYHVKSERIDHTPAQVYSKNAC